MNETASLEHDLREEVGVSVDGVYMNALYPERFSDAEADRLEAAGGESRGRNRGAHCGRRSPSIAARLPSGHSSTACGEWSAPP